MEDKVWHYRLVEKCKTFKDFPEVTHVWNRANTHSTTTKRNYKWNNCAYRHLADMLDFIEESKNEQYKKFVKNKIEQHKKNIQNGIFSQL